jgi:hypothetical protein
VILPCFLPTKPGNDGLPAKRVLAHVGSAFQATAYGAAHHAFMTLRHHTSTREDEVQPAVNRSFRLAFFRSFSQLTVNVRTRCRRFLTMLCRKPSNCSALGRGPRTTHKEQAITTLTSHMYTQEEGKERETVNMSPSNISTGDRKAFL